MVARINATSRLGAVMKYNEQKVAQGKAEFLHAKNYLQDTQRLTGPQKIQRFQRLNELNPRSDVNTLHISLNFSTHDHLSREQLIAIADKYMEGLHMEKQPYLVYQHKDAEHPHLHIVTSLIQPDGKRIRTHNIGREQSETVRKAIEKQFNLTTAENKEQRIREHLVTEKIRSSVQKVAQEYRFASMEEYSATLRTFHVAVGIGAEGSKIRQHGGLYYMAVDDRGQKISPPIMSSKLDKSATLTEVEKKYVQGKTDQEANLPSIRKRVDWAILQQPTNFQELAAELRDQSIDLVLEKNRGVGGAGEGYDLIYIDHGSKTAVSGKTLGEPYSFEGLAGKLAPAQAEDLSKTPSKDQTQTQIEPLPAGMNLKGPQVLSHLMRSEGQFSPSEPLDDDENKRRRKRPRL